VSNSSNNSNGRGSNGIDPAFTSFPLDELGAAALEQASALGVSYADFRMERRLSQQIRVRDVRLESLTTSESVGYGVRVIIEGAWGFASSDDLTPAAAAAAAAKAVEVAKALSRLNRDPVELAEEPAYNDTFVSSYEVDPFEIDDRSKIDLLVGINSKALDSKKIDHVDFFAGQVKENKFLTSTAGSRIVQQRVRTDALLEAVKIDKESGAFETMRSLCLPSSRGWELVTRDYDFEKEAEEIPELLEEKMKAPSVESGRHDLVIDPTNLWLTIHESIGHATELDRALGYEAALAGTSFATIDNLGKLQYGSGVMHITGDRVVEHGLSTIGFDDEAVKAQRWDLIKDGVLVGYQLNRQMAAKHRFGRSNGCAFADHPSHVPLQRMPNISLQPSTKDISLQDLISGVERGIYIVGDKSFSIDMQRYNFQFTGQRFYEIKSGRIAGQLKDVAYQGKTTEFWNAMEAVGGLSTFVLGGTFGCGKGQPGQSAPVSHGAPAALFRQINILNTMQERGQ
jgi:TldD protein